MRRNLLSEQNKQFLMVAAFTHFFVGWFLTGWFLFLYLLTTRFWPISLLYSAWWYHDRNTPSTGGRAVQSVQSWKGWECTRDYFSATLTLNPDFTLDPKRNYLFCCFPHSVYPIGATHNLLSNTNGFLTLFPKFRVNIAVVCWLFMMPFVRELALACGIISCSADSLKYVLSGPRGGKIVVLIPGGAEESFYGRPGRYTFTVKKRKGFVKTALRTGAPLVPVITFGEINTYQQIENEKVRAVQKFLKKILGFAPLIFYGTGFWKGSVGLTPKKTPLNTVVGMPIAVSRIENPTQEDVDNVHEIFVAELLKLFNEHKEKFLKDHEDQCLELL